MNSQPITDYSYFFNSYNNDTRPTYQTYSTSFDHGYFEDYKNQDYSFLPKQAAFFDDYTCTPLDVTRQSTDFTDVSDDTFYASPVSAKVSRLTVQEQSLNLSSMNAKITENSTKTKFIAVLGGHTGFTFNTFQSKEKQNNESELLLNKNDQGSIRTSETDINDEESRDEQSEDNEPTASQAWSEEKDDLLLKLASQYKCDWKRIVKKFDNSKISAQFLKTKYKELVNAPLQRRIKFTHKEDLMIAKYFDKYGSNWAQMATHFNDRTAVMLKNRYYSYIRKRDLLNSLVEEVREIESDDQEIDQIKDHELNFNNDSQESEEAIFYDEVSYSSLSRNGITSSASFEDRQDDVNVDEIQRLKEKVKSLQFLYLKTKIELNRYKTQGSQ